MENYSVCGIDCGKCDFKAQNKCEGCRISAAKGECVWNGRCALYDCASSQKLPHCGECKKFPCTELKKGLEGEGALDALDILKNLSKKSK